MLSNKVLEINNFGGTEMGVENVGQAYESMRENLRLAALEINSTKIG